MQRSQQSVVAGSDPIEARDLVDPSPELADRLAQWRHDVTIGRTTAGFEEWTAIHGGAVRHCIALTVGDLFDRLGDYPRDQRVLIDAELPGLFEVAACVGPHDSVAFVLPTIMCGAHFDCRTV